MKTLKTNLRLLALLLILGLAHTTAHAQCPGVWVPDSAFRAFLKTAYPQVMNAQDSLLPCQAAAVTGTMNCKNKAIANLVGIEYFSQLDSLDCSQNLINVITVLPSDLSYLSVAANQQLSSIISLPSLLEYFNCNGCSFSVLPSLPNKMRKLVCSYNLLTSLPVLPDSLREINCRSNLLSSLPALPAKLDGLYCSSNPLTSLPSLPLILTDIDCGYCNLTSIPALPNSLRILSCENNNIISLPSLPDRLIFLTCQNNQLTSLPIIPAGFTGVLQCFNNRLKNIPPLPNGVSWLSCYNNLLTSLPKLPDNLQRLYCADNQIVCLPKLPNGLWTLSANGNLFNCLPNIPTYPSFYSSIGTTLCSSHCAIGTNYISGKVFEDLNGNGVYDANEPLIAQKNISTTSANATSDHFGRFFLNLDSGAYTLQIDLPKWHPLTTPTTPYTFNFPANDSIVRDVNFGFVPTPNITDVAVSLTAVDRPRPGFSFCYNLSYKNEGTVAASGTVSLNIDPQLNYTGQTAFSFSNLPVWNSWDTTVCLTVPVSLALGTPLASTATITPTLADADTTNNRATETSVVVGSYDPNDKSCSPESLTPAEVTAGKRLTYTIRFQNTGTAEAYFVFIEDTLDAAHLDVSSLEILAASHAYEMSLSGPGHVKFMFHGINLPDSTTDEPNSHGFIKYSIRPKSSLVLGDQISNTAHIYFDFNPAIVTNTTLTEVAQSSGLSEISLGSLSLHPNPASTSVVLRADALAGQAVSLTVLDLTGRAVYQASEAVFTGQTALDLSDLPIGCYIVQLQAQGGVLSQKLVVVR